MAQIPATVGSQRVLKPVQKYPSKSPNKAPAMASDWDGAESGEIKWINCGAMFEICLLLRKKTGRFRVLSYTQNMGRIKRG